LDFTIDGRVVQMLETFQKKSYCSLDYLANSLGVSTRTIRNYIKLLNSELNGIAAIKNEKGKGYHLFIEDGHMFDDFIETVSKKKNMLDSSQRRIAFIIDRLINSKGRNTLDELAFDMNLGRTTLVNEIKKAAVALESYNLAIHGKPNSGMSLKGNELDIRFFILDNVYDYLYGDYPLDEDIKEEIMKIANHYNLESTTQKKLMQFIIVMLDRFIKNHPLTELDEKYNKLLNTQDYSIASEIVSVIERHLPVEISQPEILFITLPIAGRRTPTNIRTIADIKISDDIKRLLDLIIEQVGFDKSIIFENETFFKDILYHLTFMLNRLMFDVRLKNPQLADVKEKYPVAFKLAEIAGQVIEKEYGLKVPEDELGYLSLYFGVFIAQHDEITRALKKVAVICGTGRGSAKLVSIQLQRILNPNTQIDIYSEIEVSKELLNQYDMVFSTVKLHFAIDPPVIIINEIFDEASVSRQIEKMTYRKKFKMKDFGNHRSILKLLLNKDKFFVLDTNKGYHENVNDMIDVLVKKGYLDEGFKERLREREEKGSMVFDRYISLPHTVNYKSNQIEMAIGVFPEKAVVDGKEIKLVFLLGIPEKADNDASLLIKIYDEIIKIASDQKQVEELADAASYEDFTKCLEQASSSSSILGM